MLRGFYLPTTARLLRSINPKPIKLPSNPRLILPATGPVAGVPAEFFPLLEDELVDLPLELVELLDELVLLDEDELLDELELLLDELLESGFTQLKNS